MIQNILVSVDELWLKGRNRYLYFRALKNHIHEVVFLNHGKNFEIQKEDNRMLLYTSDFFSEETILKLSKIPGIHTLIPSIVTNATLDDMMETIATNIQSTLSKVKTFKVLCRRADKTFPMTSVEVRATIGGMVLEKFPNLQVDLHSPQLIIDIRIILNKAYICTKKYLCTGGLPVNTSGHLISLLSGGFDSPVASCLMSKRGCKITFAFFYAYPFVGEDVKAKIIQLACTLAPYQHGVELYIIPFGHLQKSISASCLDEYKTILFRKFMVDCAHQLALKIKAQGLVTGDSLGQVSSQTIGNINMIDRFTEISIFRPLIGLNKSEIIDLARTIGTHDISLIPHDDACSLFAPSHPIINPDLRYLSKYFETHQFQEDISNALNQVEIYKINPLGILSKV